MDEIVSTQNQNVKRWRRLKHKNGRKKQGAYFLENWHLVHSALAVKRPLLKIMVTPSELQRHHALLAGSSNLILISSKVAQTLGSSLHPEGVFAVAKLPHQSSLDPRNVKSGAWLLLDQIQDPGNVGTMVRTADAAGFSGVVFGQRTVDLFNPKVVRSMQGSQFHLKLTAGDLRRWIPILEKNGLPIYGTALDPQALNYRQVKPSQNFGLVMGNEGRGMQKHLLKLTTQNLYIPIPGRAESLNVAVAAGILMFRIKELVR